MKKRNQHGGHPVSGGRRGITAEEIPNLHRWALRTLARNHGPARAASWLRRRTWPEIVAFLASIATWTTIALYLRLPGGSWGEEPGEGARLALFGEAPRGGRAE